MDKLKKGTELILSLSLTLDLMEQYNAKHTLKRDINIAKKAVEKDLFKHYDAFYNEHEEFCQNSLRLKEDLIKKVAKYNEVDCMLLSEFMEHFDKNIEIARKKGQVFFNKIL